MVAADFIAYLRGHRLGDGPPWPPWFLWQWRLTNPALDVPFIFLQMVVTSIARERTIRLNLVLSGLVFGLTFYVYFYLWTVIAAGLCLAILVDRPGRRTYIWTLALGFALGWPQIVHDFLIKRTLSVEGMRYFGLMGSPHDWVVSPYPHPYIILGELLIVGLWVIHRKVPPLILVWCMSCAGVVMSLGIVVSSFFLHNYHWAWLIVPVLHVTMVAAALDLVLLWIPRLRIPAWAGALLVSAYLASGIYLTEAILTRGIDYGDYTTPYSEYTGQRLVAGVTPLRPDSVIAGEGNFADLASVAERQRPLRGRFMDDNMLLDDEERRNRFVLDQYLSGIDNHDSFVLRLKDYVLIPKVQLPAYIHTFDDIDRDPDSFIDKLKVRYLALPMAQHPPAVLSHGWNLIQSGPYFRIWERLEK